MTNNNFIFNFETRIYKYELKDENDTIIYYVKNPLKGLCQYRGLVNNTDHPLKPFPSHSSSIMKSSITSWTQETIIRKKQKNYSGDIKSIPLRRPLSGHRPSINLGNVMAKAVGAKPSLSAYEATSATLENNAGSPFFKAYFTHCNPIIDRLKRPARIEFEKSITQTLRTKQEWCHLIGYGDGGSFLSSNLVAGSYQSNTAELAIESAMRSCKDEYSKIAVKVTAYLIPYEDGPNDAYEKDSSEKGNLINYIHNNIKQDLIEKSNSKVFFITKNTLYRCLVKPSEEDIKSAKEDFFLDIANKAKIHPLTQNILKSFKPEEIALYLKKPNKADQEKKKLHNILRAAFDAISCQLYETKHATAFVRYVITIDGKFAVDFVIDGQREELDSNEFYLIRHFIYKRLITISSQNKKNPDNRIISRDTQHDEEDEWDEGDGKDGEHGKRLAYKTKPSKNKKI